MNDRKGCHYRVCCAQMIGKNQGLTSISSCEILLAAGRCCEATKSAFLGETAGLSGSLCLSGTGSRLCLSRSLSLYSLSCTTSQRFRLVQDATETDAELGHTGRQPGYRRFVHSQLSSLLHDRCTCRVGACGWLGDASDSCSMCIRSACCIGDSFIAACSCCSSRWGFMPP